MKIKHWQGYGTLNAEKLSKSTKTINGTKVYTMKIKVVGNHEYGLDCCHNKYDHYTIYNWLLTKFDRKVKELTDRCILGVHTFISSERNNEKGIDEEYAIYTIKYTLAQGNERNMLEYYSI